MKITVYTTPTCQTCNMAKKRLEAAGADVELVDLTENPEVLIGLKVDLGVAPDSPIQVPIFRDASGDLHNITGLPGLLSAAKV